MALVSFNWESSSISECVKSPIKPALATCYCRTNSYACCKYQKSSILCWVRAGSRRSLLLTGVAAASVLICCAIWLNRMSEFIDKRLQNRGGATASTVYAETPVLGNGTKVTSEWLVRYLSRLKYAKAPQSVPGVSQFSVRSDGVAFARLLRAMNLRARRFW